MQINIKKLADMKSIRYIFFGGCTTMVNLLSYAVMRYLLSIDVNLANTCSIMLAILFAYIVNKRYVFQSKTITFKETLTEAVNFVGVRLFSMFVEIFGVVLLTGVWGMNDMAGKLAIQFVVLVLNYVFSKMFVFSDKKEVPDAEKKEKRMVVLGAFSLSFLILAFGFAVNDVFPFGDRSVLIIDSAHQYLPFFTEFFRKLKDADSLLYTFSGGMGLNFWALFAYYLSSPLNFLIVLFGEDYIMEAMALLILIKTGLSGGTFAYYLNTRVKKTNVSVVAFSIMFALSNFMVGYYFNIMWLDSIALFPLVMLGIDRLVKEGKGRFYGGVLALTLFCNYYIGFMICLFSCLHYVVLLLLEKGQTIRKVISRSLCFAWYSLLSGGIAAILLIPAFKALQLTKSGGEGSGFPTEIKIYENWLDVLSQHFAFIEPITISDVQGDLNIYCGVLAMILVLLYVLNNKISLKERLIKAGVCVLLFISFNFNMLNFVWHGFHSQNGLPNRFAFLYIGFLLVLCFDAFQDLKDLSLGRILVSCLLPVGFTAYSMVMGVGEHTIYIYGGTLVLLNIYMWLMALYKLDILKAKAIQLLFLAVIVIEITANSVYGTISNGSIGREAYLSSKNSYQEMIASVNDDSFYRSEMDKTLIRNEIMYQGGNGIVVFSSTVPEATIDLVTGLGMEGRTNKSGFAGATKLTNDIFGIKYMISRTFVDTLYQYQKVDETDTHALYYNQDALSLGFMTYSNIKFWDTASEDPFIVQNDLIRKATGEEGIYTLREAFTTENSATYAFYLQPGEQVYLHINKEVESLTLTTPDYTRTNDKYTEHIYDLGCYDEETEITVEINLKDTTAYLDVSLYSYYQEDYEKVYEKLSANQMEVEVQSSNKISGSIDVDRAGTLLLTVPYDEGWSIRVDGQRVNTYAVGSALTGIDLDEGSHTIEMKYTPPGLWLGTGITLVSLILFFLHKKRTGKTELQEELNSFE